MDATCKSSDLTTSTVIAAVTTNSAAPRRAESDVTSDYADDARSAGATSSRTLLPNTQLHPRRGRLSRADQEHVLNTLLGRAGMSPSITTAPAMASASASASTSSYMRTVRLDPHAQQQSLAQSQLQRQQRQRMPSAESMLSTVSSGASSTSFPPLSPPSGRGAAGTPRASSPLSGSIQHHLSSTPPRSLPRNSSSVRIAQAIADTAPALRGAFSSASSSDGSSAAGRLSPADRRERDARRLSRLLEGHSRTVAEPGHVQEETSRSKTKTVRIVERPVLADASWEMDDVPQTLASSHSSPVRRESSSRMRGALAPSLAAASHSTPRKPPPMAVGISPRRIDSTPASTSLASDAAMSELEAEYDALRQRLEDAKRRFTKWHGVVAVKVREEGVQRKRARLAKMEAELKEADRQEMDGSPPHEEEERDEDENEDHRDEIEHSIEERSETRSDAVDTEKDASQTASTSDEDKKVTTHGDDVAADGSTSTSSWRRSPSSSSKLLLPAKPVLGTTLTLSLLWTCGYLVTLLQWHMQQQGQASSGGGHVYSDADRRWMSEYYDPMYPELYGEQAMRMERAGGAGSRALASALQLLGGLSLG
ncbi:hypothetical protein OC834_002720 [Tilletia horrida]|uniref:Uncharacterized protein n=1 Tax=Tilletia horrida TaxID=155126 RepID=A0AAN6JKT9_9BASI|nr:hypothetical protein OC835_004208 [Tilletia horrida]KAK0532124.1 hypothetical protein OC834_002720 [Tilletia horrida]KAK0533357.1 hypothetical protein OC842_002989 [Tilletia horrida]KAK0566917.1 hypothetical protein OC844_000515 [Tilletia horrida]